MPEKTKTLEEVKNEVREVINNVVGKINDIDSRSEKAELTTETLNQVIAGVELSKLEKAGILAYLTKKRLG